MDLRVRRNDADIPRVLGPKNSLSTMGSWICVRKNSNMSQHRVYWQSKFISEAVRKRVCYSRQSSPP